MKPDFANLPLRDIHLPEPVSWWPPAPGWWALLVLSILLLSAGLWWRSRWVERRRLYRSAMQELSKLEQQFREHKDAQQLVEPLSVLLRRISLSCYPKAQIASLTGTAWLEFLDRPFAGETDRPLFSDDLGKVLVEAPYNPRLKVDAGALLDRAGAWIRAVTLRRGTP